MRCPLPRRTSRRRDLALVLACLAALLLPACGDDVRESEAPREAAPADPVAPPPPDSSLGMEPAVMGPAVRFRWQLPEGVVPDAETRAWWEEDAESGGGTLQQVTLGSDHVIVQVPPGEGIVAIYVPGCVVVQSPVRAEADVITDSGTLTFRRSHLLEGRVQDERGKAIEGASVWPNAGELSVPLTSTDEEGRFAFDGLPDGEVRLRVESDDHVRKTVVVRNGPDVAPETITLEKGGSIAGLVVDADGNPDADAYVWIVDPLDDENRDRMAWPSVEMDGTFSVRLAAGRYRVNGRSDAGSGSVTVEVHEGEATEVRLVLEPR